MVFPAKAGIKVATGTMFYVYLLASKPYGMLARSRGSPRAMGYVTLSG